MASAIPRLKRRAEFLKVAATGRKWVTRGLILQERRRNDENSPRIGYTVSKKVGNAVRRNRARRRLRAAVEQVMPRWGKTGRDYVLIGRFDTVDRPFDALVGDLETAFERIETAPKGRRWKGKRPAGK